jgi:hypothetical protein
MYLSVLADLWSDVVKFLWIYRVIGSNEEPRSKLLGIFVG